MPLFKEKKCLCGLKLKDVEVLPNPLGDYFCPVCGRDLTPIKGKVKPEAEAPAEEAPAEEVPAEEAPAEEVPAEEVPAEEAAEAEEATSEE